jgi:hypothetical protein
LLPALQIDDMLIVKEQQDVGNRDDFSQLVAIID